MLPAVALLAAALIPASAAAQMVQPGATCDQRDKILGQLAQKYHEKPVVIGVTSEGRLVEVLSTVDGATWTIILTTTGGMSCVLAAGEGLRLLRQPVEEGPAV